MMRSSAGAHGLMFEWLPWQQTTAYLKPSPVFLYYRRLSMRYSLVIDAVVSFNPIDEASVSCCVSDMRMGSSDTS